MTQDYWNKKFQKKAHYGSVHTSFAQECLQFLQQYPHHKKMLDLGCGQGQDALFFTENGYTITALDFSQQALASFNHSKIKKVSGDMRNLSQFKDDSFDIVYSSFSMHFFRLEELHIIFKEIHRILKPNSFLMFIAKNKKDKYYGKGERIDNETFIHEGMLRYFFTEPILKQLLTDFKIIHFKESSKFHKSEEPTFYFGIIAEKM